jgi:hypothetical protein
MPNVEYQPQIQVGVAVNPENNNNNNNEIPVRRRNRLIRQAQNQILNRAVDNFIRELPPPPEIPEQDVGIRPVQANPFDNWIQNPVRENPIMEGIQAILNNKNKKETNKDNGNKMKTIWEWMQSPSLDIETANIKKWFREFNTQPEMRSPWWNKHVVVGLVDVDPEFYSIIPHPKDKRLVLICPANLPKEKNALNTLSFISLQLKSLKLKEL